LHILMNATHLIGIGYFFLSFFLSFLLSLFLSYSGLLLPSICKCRGLLLHFITLSDTHTHKHTFGKIPGTSTTQHIHTIHKREASMLPAGFEPTIPANEQPQTYALDRGDTWIRHFSSEKCF
jgi:hypothetical protein